MSMDTKALKESTLIQEAIRVCRSFRDGGRFRTSYQPELLKEMLEVAIDCPEKPEDFKLDIGLRQSTQLTDRICLLSGGADSTIAWHLFGKPDGVYVDIGQPYSDKEIACLKELDIPTYIVNLSSSNIGYPLEKWKHIIPGRNFLFLTIAAEFLKDEGEIILSIVDGEGWDSGKGDKSRVFIEKWIVWYYKLTKKKINITTLTQRTKAGWLKEFASCGYDLNIIRHKTVTCFSEENGQCGKCQACLRKYLSFVTNDMDISEDFNVHPMIGANEYIHKYTIVLSEALSKNDFSHYSKNRCIEDLDAIRTAEVRVHG